MPEDLKVSQISSSLLPPPFRGLHSPGVRKHCQIIFACYFRKLSIVRMRQGSGQHTSGRISGMSGTQVKHQECHTFRQHVNMSDTQAARQICQAFMQNVRCVRHSGRTSGMWNLQEEHMSGMLALQTDCQYVRHSRKVARMEHENRQHIFR